jgi:CheY-like chemotaxis protein
MKTQLLIIDDAIDQIELVQAVFQMVDPNLRMAYYLDGAEALAQLRNYPELRPQIILLDLRMPRKTGHEILEELKNDPNLRQIPVCAFSSSDSQKDIEAAYALGANFYFQKPNGIEKLIAFAQAFKTLWFDCASLP